MKDKKILVGITGGIAAYKAAELVRIIVKNGADATVAMTSNATRFITPLTLETLCGKRVVWKMFDGGSVPLEHISWGQDQDLIIIAPATANFLSKMAHGLADDFLSTVVLAASAPILACPSMNSRMFNNEAVQNNIRILTQRGIEVMKPDEGELACNTVGPGRLPDPEKIAEQARFILSRKDLASLKILVTAGATIEPIDPVRYISNRSSGKMGYAVAKAARMRGASVILVSGPTYLPPPHGIRLLAVETAEEMRKVVIEHSAESDIIIKAAAVSDYRPRESSMHKLKKGRDSVSLDLVKNTDILEELGRAKSTYGYLLVGFAAETEDLILNARRKMEEKNLDLIVANDVSRVDSGFRTETNLVKIIYSDGRMDELPLLTKDEVADQLLDRIISLKERKA
ncbi:MAG: bifunctional phosphopantothenoylcysteine decarboxylase/phosphopantothenate--cysteine ligase CoaBC [Deltaproteobacteria bacterium]|nr:bifunctional phosphopantothenoylcysteine decarboxylase/phosphopantothenate--cysteine ligase CoaBC [Deltaproteobacteria bacterium]